LLVFVLIEIFLLKDSPARAGHKDFDTHDASSGEEHLTFTPFQIYKKILTNKIIITIAIIEFCSGVLRNGIMHWYRIFLGEQGIKKDFFFLDNWGLLLMVCGVYSAIVAGFVSDKIFKSRRTPVAALFYGLMTACTIGMIFSLTNNIVLGVWSMLISLCVIGVHGLLSGTATMDFGGRKGAATAVGVIDGFVYLGTGIQSIVIGNLVKGGDWTYWPVFLVPFALLGTILAIKIWHAFPHAKGKGGH
jgi:OPA family glycerol-3-phosphate transporter-like MFS transporter